MPIANERDFTEVQNRLNDILNEGDTERRIRNIRTLFIETLDWQYSDGLVALHNGRDDNLPSDAHLVASRDGISAVYVPLLTDADTDRVTAAAVNVAARSLRDTLSDDLLLLLTNRSSDQFHIIRPDLTHTRPHLQRMVARRGEHHRTIVQQLANMWNDYGREGKSVHEAIIAAFSVEPVTERFFAEYRRVFENAKNAVTGFEDERDLHLFTQTLFNRLMFVYFISRKGWLSFQDEDGNDDNDYLNALWRDYESRRTSESNFHVDRLRLLFFAGLNNPKSEDLTEYPDALRLIGSVPFLNGGLFEETDMDARSDIYVPDAVILPILRDLFDPFNFTVTESTPYDTEVAVDPEMLGKVFEELVNERHESGAYYTPRPVVSFMCREALKGFLASAATGLSDDAISGFVDAQNTQDISVADARKVAAALERVTVVDPACGSGAYLLGMMQELVDLQTTLFNAGAGSKSIYDLKLEIIRRNLYGADIDDFAVNIAMLRLWLSLVIEYEGDKPEPLPNLDFKITCGDSLLAPDPSPQNYGDLFGDFIRQFDLGRLKAEHMRTTEQAEKDRLKAEIEDARQQIREMLGDAAGDDILDWRVEFAEVMGDGGFDIVIANPPYVQLQREGGNLARLYRNVGYQTFVRTGDIYYLFYERGISLAKQDIGQICFISSNQWMRVNSGRVLRKFFESQNPIRLINLGAGIFDSATVNTCILMVRRAENENILRVATVGQSGQQFPPSKWTHTRPANGETWVVLSNAEQRIKDKMEAVGTPLIDWGMSIKYGVKTGYNNAFIIDNATKEALIAADSKSAEIIKPILRGRDVERFQARWANLWLIDTHNGYSNIPAIEVDDYPVVKSHLNTFQARLTKRQDKGKTPYNLRNCAYYEEFTEDKIVWGNLNNQAKYSYAPKDMYIIAPTTMLTPYSPYLLAILNSSLTDWYFRLIGVERDGGYYEYKPMFIERLPIPKISAAEQRSFVGLVDEIIEAKAADPLADTSELEEEIDWLVYDLYGLTDEETAIIADAFWKGEVSEEEEDAALVRSIEVGLRSKRVDIEEVKSILRERHEARN